MGLYVNHVLATRPFPESYAVLFITASALITLAILSFCFADERDAVVPDERTPFRKFLRRGPSLLKDVKRLTGCSSRGGRCWASG